MGIIKKLPWFGQLGESIIKYNTKEYMDEIEQKKVDEKEFMHMMMMTQLEAAVTSIISVVETLEEQGRQSVTVEELRKFAGYAQELVDEEKAKASEVKHAE
jgi:hypothetical protein